MGKTTGLAGLLRTHHCGELRTSHEGMKVTLCGWVNKYRNLGGLHFIDLRDKFGLTQLSFANYKGDLLELKNASLESVLKVEGIVSARPTDAKNPQMLTGEIEILVEKWEILSKAKEPPFLPHGKVEATEELRLRYRYLDLRSQKLQAILTQKTQIMQTIRNVLVEESFTEVETPILYKTTPEGARDFIVPSRIHPGTVYALPQSPQTLKQLLMIGGTDKYFQIARCFRDEALRADRQPEFTQIDIEVSFVTQDYMRNLLEKMVIRLFNFPTDYKLPVMDYKEALTRYGSDKPDVRFGLEHKVITDLFKTSAFTQLQTIATAEDGEGMIKAFFLPASQGEMARKDLDNLKSVVSPFGVENVFWFKVGSEGKSGGISKFIDETIYNSLVSLSPEAQSNPNGLWFIVGHKIADQAHSALDVLRRFVADKFNLIPQDVYKFLWVNNFPLLEYDEERKRFVAKHHPFTAPLKEDLPLYFGNDHKGLIKCRGDAYDIVCNGYEMGGGSLRIYDNQVQERMFELLGMSTEEVTHQFGFFIEALQYGTPPHGGIALGLDRIVMLLAKTDNIRDVMAFPKTTSATDLMAGAPSIPSNDQTSELHFTWKKS